MFEPESDIERMLVRASTQPSERWTFLHALLDAEIFVVLVPEGDGPIVPGPDGNAVIPEGTKLSLPGVMRGEERLFPFFTAPTRARAWFKADHPITSERTRDLFSRYPGAPFMLNAGSDYGKEFLPDEVKRPLAGDLGEGVDTTNVPEGERLLLGHPSEVPTDRPRRRARPRVCRDRHCARRLADAGQAREPSRAELNARRRPPGRLAGVLDAITRAVKGDVLNGRKLGAMPLDASQMSVTLRTGIPILAAAP